LSAERAAPFSLSVGTQSIGAKYKFTEDSLLVESAKQMAALGSDTLKIALTPKYEDDYMMTHDPEIDSVLDLALRKPGFHEVMDMPFRNIMLWVYPFSDSRDAFFKGVFSEADAQGIYEEMYALTVHILERYSGSGKSFFLGNWEGDWHVQSERYDYEADPRPEVIAASIEWFRMREKAIADARRDTPHHDVEVYYYIELNHVRKSMDRGKPSIVNKILPYIKTDFVSWSSYDVTKPAVLMEDEAKGRERVFQALDYIEAHLPESDIPGKRVFVGEYGFELMSFPDRELQSKYTAQIMKWSLEWGCPFVLYWELYCNEVTDAGEHRGYWLIDDRGDKQPVWFFHKEFLDRANAFVENYQKEHGKLPDQQVYNREAASWIQKFSTYDVEDHHE